MKYEISCGALIFTKINGETYWVIIRSKEGIYGFPKGHTESGETELETAMREVWEETHLKPAFIDGFIAEDEYPLPKKPGVMKKVIYFLAEYENQEIIFQKEELMGAYLMTYDEAMESLQFQPSRDILKKANEFIKNMGDYNMNRREKALENHHKGYNCAQAVLCAFTDLTDFTEDELFRLSEGFGFGMGTMGVCGAVSAMAFLAGLKNSFGIEKLPETNKKTSYAKIKELIDEFENMNGTVLCSKLKGEEVRSCDGCIEDAVKILEEKLG